ncbi:hypothetical protein HPG69_014025, partial [Diceros bicornis minor]
GGQEAEVEPLTPESEAEHPDFKLEVNKSMRIQEGLCIPVPCSVSYPWRGWNKSTPACVYWFQNRDKPGDRYGTAYKEEEDGMWGPQGT